MALELVTIEELFPFKMPLYLGIPLQTVFLFPHYLHNPFFLFDSHFTDL